MRDRLSGAAIWLALFIAFTAATLLGFTGTGSAMQCAPEHIVFGQLQARFNEAPAMLGVAGDGKYRMTFFSSDAGTWTMTMTRSDGRTCIMAAGEALAVMEKPDQPEY